MNKTYYLDSAVTVVFSHAVYVHWVSVFPEHVCTLGAVF
jgi:hypothetical protein